MDNQNQVSEIRKYQEHLATLIGRQIDRNMVARIWIRKYAKLWRLRHPVHPTSEQ
jgi:hypothetical protein